MHMQIEAICLEKSDESIRQALGSLPRNFPEIFQCILDNRKHFAEKLSWEGFNSQVSTVRAPPLSVGSMPVHIVESIPKRNRKLQILAMKLLNGEMKSVDATIDIVSRSSRFNNSTDTQFNFLKYAQNYWLHHTKKASNIPSGLFHLFKNLVWKTELVENASLWKEHPPTATRLINKQCAWARHHSHCGFLKVYSTNLAIEELIDAERAINESLGTLLLSFSDLYRFLIRQHASLISTLEALLLAVEETNSMPRYLQQWGSCCEFIEARVEHVSQQYRGLYNGIFETLRINTWKVKDCPDRWVKVLDNYFTPPIYRMATCWKQLKVSLTWSALASHL